MSERKELVGTVGELLSIIQQMAAVFDNDRAPDRADHIHDLAARGYKLARPLLDRFPPDYGQPKIRNRDLATDLTP